MNASSRSAAMPPKQAAAVAVSVVAGVAVYLVGLPESVTWFKGTDDETRLSDLTLPAALFVAFAGISLAAMRTASRRSWQVVDIVVASVLGVAGGLLFAVWNVGWEAWSKSILPPASAVFVGVWLLPAVLGALIVRRPGAAVYTELVAAVVSALIGNQWGFATVWYGLVEGMGAEVVFALLLYRSWSLVPALLGGAGAGVAVGLMDSLLYYPEVLDGAGRTAYVLLAVLSGVVIAGLGSWALVRALARTGVLSGLASGRAAERV